ncbi:hypothetical protein BIY22_03300 [Vibrio panuliri]|uniref:Uncharacterized protein n=2 Tax=Vibrio panuliri TaxID=1381081 RepID=A0A1Q9HRS7_9VIBR|nr:hypothetical protein BIY22_03300 [Vibrio panuliri]
MSALVSTSAFAVTPSCEYIAKESKYYGTSPLNGLELVASDQKSVNPTKLTFSDHFNQYLRIENFQSVRMHEYKEENGVFSFVTTEKKSSGFYKGLTLKVELTKVSETEYDVMFKTDKEYQGEIGKKTVVWSAEHHKNILRDRKADRTKPIRYNVTPESLEKVKTFKCEPKK